MPDMMQIGLALVKKFNPKALNTPLGQQFQQIVQTGDYQKGEQVAQNLCNSYGVSREDALQQAMNYFNNMH